MPADVPFTQLAEVNPRRALRRGVKYPFIEMAAVPEGGGHPTHLEEREFSNGGSKFTVGDTLFARITPCTENGKLAYVEALPGGDVGFGSTELIVLSAREGKAEPRFIYQVAASAKVREAAVARMLGTSGRQRVPTWFFTEELRVPQFSLSEQRAIAAVLDAVDDTIERTEAVIAATEELRRSLLEELLTRGVPGWHPEWKQVPRLGTVPACWDVVRLEQVAGVQTGRAVNRKSSGNGPIEVPYLSVANVKDGYLALDNVKTMRVVEDDLRRYGLRAGDVLFTEGGDADKLGRGTVWRGEIAPCLHQNHVFAVRPHEGTLLPDFLAAVASSRAGRRYFLGAAKQTTNLASINSTQLKSMPIPTPPITEQERIVEVLGAAADAQALHVAARKHLITAKAATADALLTGRVRLTAGAEAAT